MKTDIHNKDKKKDQGELENGRLVSLHAPYLLILPSLVARNSYP